MSRKILVGLVVLMVVGLSGGYYLQQRGSADTSVSGSQKVSLLAFGSPEELKAYRNVISSYQDKNTGSQIQLIEASNRQDLLTRLATGFAGGNPPDLFLINYRYYAQFASRGAIEPVDSRLKTSTTLAAEDYYPQAMQPFQVDGRQLCMPQNISSLAVYYNKDLFRAAGVAEPAADWSWDDMVAAAKALSRDTDGDGAIDQHGLGVEPDIIRVAPFVWSNGGELARGSGDKLRLDLDTPQAKEAIQDFLDLHQVHDVVVSEPEYESEDFETRFQNGGLAMYMSSRRSTPVFRTIKSFDWDVAALPRHQQAASVLHADAYCMSARGEHKDAAWKFLEFAVGPDGQRIAAATGRTVPSLKAVSKSSAFLDPAARPASSQVFLDSIASIRPLPVTPAWPELEKTINNILEAAFYQEGPFKDVTVSADTVVDEITRKTEPVLNRQER